MQAPLSITRWRDGHSTGEMDYLSIEEPFAIRLDGKPFATLMRSPGQDRALLLGFLFSEGVIASAADIAALALHAGEADLTLSPAAKLRIPWARSVQVSSSCGVCGRAVIDEMLERLLPLQPWHPDPAFLAGLLPQMRPAQDAFARTGGVHAACLFNEAGILMAIEEDVGRHNAIDKIVGAALEDSRLPLSRHILVVTSRASFDIVQKAALAGITVVVALGAASTLAVELARHAQLRLYWFARPGHLVTYG